MPLDELQALALMRARDQARAVLGVVRDAMVEIERPALLAVCALLADGHLLIEDVPGVGKTTLARVVARAIGGHDARIQCTGDLAAEDVVGRLIPADGFREETFEHGPIFANAVVLDEFNRATPRLQSSLLAAMEERVVTAGKQRHALPRPFFAVGTMNPHDNSGTYELGFAQRDRFAIRTGLGYASATGEVDLIDRFSAFDVTAEIDPIIAPGDLVKLQRAVELVRAPQPVKNYLVDLVRATRVHKDVEVGASPRAILTTFRCCQALTMLRNDPEVTFAHVRDMFPPCIEHRLRLREGASAAAVILDLLESVPEPAAEEPPLARAA
ncbi:MAG TPA: MoxR family ATPase [Gaiellales bacterium]|jgi:MoxR-like ATPase